MRTLCLTSLGDDPGPTDSVVPPSGEISGGNRGARAALAASGVRGGRAHNGFKVPSGFLPRPSHPPPLLGGAGWGGAGGGGCALAHPWPLIHVLPVEGDASLIHGAAPAPPEPVGLDHLTPELPLLS